MSFYGSCTICEFRSDPFNDLDVADHITQTGHLVEQVTDDDGHDAPETTTTTDDAVHLDSYGRENLGP